MLKIKNLTPPSPEQFSVAIKGVRNAFKSTFKSDSGICENSEMLTELCFVGCPHVIEWEGEDPIVDPVCDYDTYTEGPIFVLGSIDKILLLSLIQAGDPSHRKFLRQLPVIMDITAPLYWFKQFDTYKVGTCANSESTMHTITKNKFSIYDFSLDFAEKTNEPLEMGTYADVFSSFILEELNELREKYLETKDMNYWHTLNEFLPQSYNQTRTVSLNYEVLLTIIKQRSGHKLGEWKTFIDYVLEHVPYLKEFAKAAGLTKK